MAVAIVAVALAAGPALAASPAYAKESQTVKFTGGSVLSMLVCRSEPSNARLTIPAESRVMFVNRLGQAAMLRVDGRPLVQVGPNQAAPMVFHRGPVSVSMTFSCGAGVVQQFSSTSVSVTGAGAKPAASASLRPTTGATAGVTHSSPVRTRSSNTGRAALSPAHPATESPAATGAPGLGGSPTAGQSAAPVDPMGAAGTGAGKGGNAVAVEPLVTASGTPRDSASGLLALLAAVCAIGVTVAVTRAIISKRTNQASYA